MAQIQVKVYSNELQKQLFPDNSFYKKSLGLTGLAADAATFEIPQLGSISEAKEGAPLILPLQVKKSDDSSATGTMKLLYCDPLLIEDEEEIVTNYSKRQAKQQQQASALNTKAGDYAAKMWLPSATGSIVVTTGTGRASNLSGLSANRKAVTKADMLSVFNALLRMNVGDIPGQMYGLLTPDAYTDLLGISDFVDYTKTGYVTKLEQGILGRILGIEIMVRSKSGSIGAWYNASNVVVTSVASAATDRPASVFWHEKLVCHAEAHAKTLLKVDDPTYLGTVLNSTVRFGAEKCRSDQAGVVGLAEVPA